MSTQVPAGGSPASITPPQAEATPEAKTIKPIKGLPGLFNPKNDRQDAALARFKAAKAAKPAEGSEHLNPAITDSPAKVPPKVAGAAQAQGTDVPTKADTGQREGDETAPKPDPAKQAPDATAPTAVATTEPFEFAGEKWDTRDKAEHAVKTMKGMHKALVKRAEDESSKAEGWYKEAQRLRSEVDLLKTGKSATAPVGGSAVPTQNAPAHATAASTGDASGARLGKLLEAVNPQTFEQIKERSGDTVAILWALEKLAAMQEERFTSALDSRFKPVEEQSKSSAEVKRIVDTFTGVASLTDPASGDPLYPEFADPTFLNAAVHVWREMEMSEGVAYSHKGIHAAYLAAKDFFSRSGIQIAGSKPTTAPPPTRASEAAVDKVAEAVAAGLNGRANGGSGVLGATVVPPHRPASAASTPELEIRRRILAAETVNPKLGFAVTAR